MSQNRLKDFYDQLYQGNPGVFGDSSLQFLKKVLDVNAFSGKFALDIGSGEGVTAQLLAESGFAVDAVDISSNSFSAITDHEKISTFNIAIEDFKPAHTYDLVLFALTAHHLNKTLFAEVIEELQKHTSSFGFHCYRIFTTNSDFYKHSDMTAFYDDGNSLDALYKDWKILQDELVVMKASTTEAVNEIREVVYCKQ